MEPYGAWIILVAVLSFISGFLLGKVAGYRTGKNENNLSEQSVVELKKYELDRLAETAIRQFKVKLENEKEKTNE